MYAKKLGYCLNRRMAGIKVRQVRNVWPNVFRASRFIPASSAFMIQSGFVKKTFLLQSPNFYKYHNFTIFFSHSSRNYNNAKGILTF